MERHKLNREGLSAPPAHDETENVWGEPMGIIPQKGDRRATGRWNGESPSFRRARAIEREILEEPVFKDDDFALYSCELR